MLPEIRPSSEVYGEVKGGGFAGVQIAGDLGDQQAATFGQTCFAVGEAKNTYGTGNFLLLNTGTEAVQSKNGLLTTVCYKIGDDDGGLLPRGLDRDDRRARAVAARQPEADQGRAGGRGAGASRSTTTAACYIVPAFSGLFAPYWKSNARGVFAGLTRYVNAGHIARATLEATAFQSREVVEAMNADSGVDARVAEGRRRHGRQRPADAVPGRPARRAGHPAERGGDHRARRGLRRRPGHRLLGQRGGPARELAGGQALGAARWTPATRDEYFKFWKKAVTRTFDWFETE